MYPRLVQFGHFAIPTYGAFTALALIGGLAALVVLARRLGLNPNKLWNLGLVGILTALIGSRLLMVAVYFSAFRQHPFWALGLAANHLPWIGAVAVLLGIVSALLYAMAEGLPLPRVLDCVAPAAALALAINRIGAFLAGLDYGLPATSGWSVTYTSRFAALWYGTPLGVPVYPVQLYQAVACLVILTVLLWWLPRRRQDGELAGAWLFVTGLAGAFLDLYRAPGRSPFWFHQAVFLAMVLASAALLVRRSSNLRADANSYTVVDDPRHT
ncbi:MAG: prolipoprotein diacylglyceryl transferase family protein [Acidobacteriaceae bacterium]